jgi:hypothetical protein
LVRTSIDHRNNISDAPKATNAVGKNPSTTTLSKIEYMLNCELNAQTYLVCAAPVQ